MEIIKISMKELCNVLNR